MANALPIDPIRAVARKAVSGAASLALRQALVQVTNLLGVILLARLLSPAEFGVYALVTFAQSFLARFGDAGLGASLIRSEAEPGAREYRAVFSFQQILIGGVVVAFALAAPSVARAYGLGGEYALTLRLVALAFFFSGLRAIPTIRLERTLRFDRLAIVDTLEALAYNVTAVALAYLGFGATSFALAMLLRSLLGAVAIQLLAPAELGWTWDWPLVRKHLGFGIAFQGIGLVSLVKDSITPVLVGLTLGAADVGYINWSQTLAVYALMALSPFHRLYLPMFARVSHDSAALARFVERTIWATNAVTAPLAVTTVALFEPITRIVFGTQWLQAKPLFLLVAFANLFVPTVTPLLGLFNALGHSRLALSFAVVWMLSTWLLGAPLVLWLGAVGFALANALVQFTNFAVFERARRLVPFRIVPVVGRVWLCAFAGGAGALWLERMHPATNARGLIAYVLVSLASFACLLLLIDKGQARAALAALSRRT
ncbi:MAG: oligosaccharide flippase family protein [Myxococcota bacterium]